MTSVIPITAPERVLADGQDDAAEGATDTSNERAISKKSEDVSLRDGIRPDDLTTENDGGGEG